jgi:hypothetical protein
MGITGRTRCFVTMEYTTNESKMHSQSDCPVKLASAYYYDRQDIGYDDVG